MQVIDVAVAVVGDDDGQGNGLIGQERSGGQSGYAQLERVAAACTAGGCGREEGRKSDMAADAVTRTRGRAVGAIVGAPPVVIGVDVAATSIAQRLVAVAGDAALIKHCRAARL